MKMIRSVLFGSAGKLPVSLIGLLALVSGSSLWAQGVITQIDNTAHFAYSNGPDNPVAFLLPFAEPGHFAIGESFVVPEGTNSIQSLALWIKPAQALSDLHLNMYLAQWDPGASRIKGTPLSLQGPDGYMYFQYPLTAVGYYQLFFDTEGKAPARAGTSYMMFMTADEFLPGNPETPKFGYIPTGAYDDGSAWTSGGSSVADLGGTAWEPWAGDLAFAVQFTQGESPPLTPVPEPASYGLMAGCGLAALAIFKRNRRAMSLVRRMA